MLPGLWVSVFFRKHDVLMSNPTLSSYSILSICTLYLQMKGPEAVRHIRNQGYKDLKVFGLTGNVMVEDVDMFIQSGADRVLEKPLDLSAFEEALRFEL